MGEKFFERMPLAISFIVEYGERVMAYCARVSAHEMEVKQGERGKGSQKD